MPGLIENAKAVLKTFQEAVRNNPKSYDLKDPAYAQFSMCVNADNADALVVYEQAKKLMPSMKADLLRGRVESFLDENEFEYRWRTRMVGVLRAAQATAQNGKFSPEAKSSASTAAINGFQEHMGLEAKSDRSTTPVPLKLKAKVIATKDAPISEQEIVEEYYQTAPDIKTEQDGNNPANYRINKNAEKHVQNVIAALKNDPSEAFKKYIHVWLTSDRCTCPHLASYYDTLLANLLAEGLLFELTFSSAEKLYLNQLLRDKPALLNLLAKSIVKDKNLQDKFDAFFQLPEDAVKAAAAAASAEADVSAAASAAAAADTAEDFRLSMGTVSTAAIAARVAKSNATIKAKEAKVDKTLVAAVPLIKVVKESLTKKIARYTKYLFTESVETSAYLRKAEEMVRHASASLSGKPSQALTKAVTNISDAVEYGSPLVIFETVIQEAKTVAEDKDSKGKNAAAFLSAADKFTGDTSNQREYNLHKGRQNFIDGLNRICHPQNTEAGESKGVDSDTVGEISETTKFALVQHAQQVAEILARNNRSPRLQIEVLNWLLADKTSASFIAYRDLLLPHLLAKGVLFKLTLNATQKAQLAKCLNNNPKLMDLLVENISAGKVAVPVKFFEEEGLENTEVRTLLANKLERYQLFLSMPTFIVDARAALKEMAEGGGCKEQIDEISAAIENGAFVDICNTFLEQIEIEKEKSFFAINKNFIKKGEEFLAKHKNTYLARKAMVANFSVDERNQFWVEEKVTAPADSKSDSDAATASAESKSDADTAAASAASMSLTATDDQAMSRKTLLSEYRLVEEYFLAFCGETINIEAINVDQHIARVIAALQNPTVIAALKKFALQTLIGSGQFNKEYGRKLLAALQSAKCLHLLQLTAKEGDWSSLTYARKNEPALGEHHDAVLAAILGSGDFLQLSYTDDDKLQIGDILRNNPWLLDLLAKNIVNGSVVQDQFNQFFTFDAKTSDDDRLSRHIQRHLGEGLVLIQDQMLQLQNTVKDNLQKKVARYSSVTSAETFMQNAKAALAAMRKGFNPGRVFGASDPSRFDAIERVSNSIEHDSPSRILAVFRAEVEAIRKAGNYGNGSTFLTAAEQFIDKYTKDVGNDYKWPVAMDEFVLTQSKELASRAAKVSAAVSEIKASEDVAASAAGSDDAKVETKATEVAPSRLSFSTKTSEIDFGYIYKAQLSTEVKVDAKADAKTDGSVVAAAPALESKRGQQPPATSNQVVKVSISEQAVVEEFFQACYGKKKTLGMEHIEKILFLLAQKDATPLFKAFVKHALFGDHKLKKYSAYLFARMVERESFITLKFSESEIIKSSKPLALENYFQFCVDQCINNAGLKTRILNKVEALQNYVPEIIYQQLRTAVDMSHSSVKDLENGADSQVKAMALTAIDQLEKLNADADRKLKVKIIAELKDVVRDKGRQEICDKFLAVAAMVRNKPSAYHPSVLFYLDKFIAASKNNNFVLRLEAAVTLNGLMMQDIAQELAAQTAAKEALKRMSAGVTAVVAQEAQQRAAAGDQAGAKTGQGQTAGVGTGRGGLSLGSDGDEEQNADDAVEDTGSQHIAAPHR